MSTPHFLYQCNRCRSTHSSDEWNLTTYQRLYSTNKKTTTYGNMTRIENAKFKGSTYYNCPSCRHEMWDNTITRVFPGKNKEASVFLRKEGVHHG